PRAPSSSTSRSSTTLPAKLGSNRSGAATNSVPGSGSMPRGYEPARPAGRECDGESRGVQDGPGVGRRAGPGAGLAGSGDELAEPVEEPPAGARHGHEHEALAGALLDQGAGADGTLVEVELGGAASHQGEHVPLLGRGGGQRADDLGAAVLACPVEDGANSGEGGGTGSPGVDHRLLEVDRLVDHHPVDLAGEQRVPAQLECREQVELVVEGLG